MRVLSDPVTVSREYFLTNPLYNFLYEKERKICRSVSQETCLILEERLPKKVQFLTKCLMVFCICLFLGKQAFFMQHRSFFDLPYGMLTVEPYHLKAALPNAKGLIGCDGIQSIHAFPQAAADAMTSVLRACLREFFTNQEENPAAFLS